MNRTLALGIGAVIALALARLVWPDVTALLYGVGCEAAQGFGRLVGNEAITNYGCRMVGGLGITLQLVAISVGLGVVLGFLVALVRLYGGPVSSRIATGYTTFFRGTPLLCQLFLVYYGLGQFSDFWKQVDIVTWLPNIILSLYNRLPLFGSVNLIEPFFPNLVLWNYIRDAFFCAAFTFTINTAAYQAEIFRGAIASVHRGQWEAAKALGLRFTTILRTIVMPQAALVALRPLGNELVIMVKSSAVASLVTIFDLMGTTRLAFARSFDLSVYLFAALLYLCVVEVIRRVWGLAERRLTRHLSHA